MWRSLKFASGATAGGGDGDDDDNIIIILLSTLIIVINIRRVQDRLQVTIPHNLYTINHNTRKFFIQVLVRRQIASLIHVLIFRKSIERFKMYLKQKSKLFDVCDCRDDCDVLLDRLHRAGVPLLVFSAGIGNVIEEVFKIKAHLHDNIKIVSNFMTFDQEVGSSL